MSGPDCLDIKIGLNSAVLANKRYRPDNGRVDGGRILYSHNPGFGSEVVVVSGVD